MALEMGNIINMMIIISLHNSNTAKKVLIYKSEIKKRNDWLEHVTD